MTITTATAATTATSPSSTSCRGARNKKVVRIRVTKETADHLRLLAHDGEDWNDIIRRLITTYCEEDKNSILREAKRFYLTND